MELLDIVIVDSITATVIQFDTRNRLQKAKRFVTRFSSNILKSVPSTRILFSFPLDKCGLCHTTHYISHYVCLCAFVACDRNRVRPPLVYGTVLFFRFVRRGCRRPRSTNATGRIAVYLHVKLPSHCGTSCLHALSEAAAAAEAGQVYWVCMCV